MARGDRVDWQVMSFRLAPRTVAALDRRAKRDGVSRGEWLSAQVAALVTDRPLPARPVDPSTLRKRAARPAREVTPIPKDKHKPRPSRTR